MSEKQEEQIQTALRFPASFFDRLDKAAKLMSEPGMSVTRTEVLRLAAFRGLKEIEAEQKKSR